MVEMEAMDKAPENRPTALITGAARRIGASIARALHAEGMNVIVHYRRSQAEAQQLLAALNRKREASAHAIRADLKDLKSIRRLARESLKRWGRLDALINNASAFHASSLENLDDELWEMEATDKAPENRPTAPIAGAARRIGASIAGVPHAECRNGNGNNGQSP